MTTVVISDIDGNELEKLELAVGDVLPYVNLIKAFGYLGSDADEYEFSTAQVLDGNYVYVDVK